MKHKHPHGVENTKSNPRRIWVCEECNCVFTDEAIRKDIAQSKWGHICKEKRYKEEHRCEAHLEPYLPAPNWVKKMKLVHSYRDHNFYK